MAKISTYEITGRPRPTDIVIGSDPDEGFKTKNFTLQQLADFVSDNDGYLRITEYDVENDASLYDYHGGTLKSGIWVINRYLKTTLEKTSVTADDYPQYNLSQAWSQRDTLNYN